MRILTACLQGEPYHRIPAYGFWRTYFENGTLEARHVYVEVPDVDWALALALSERCQLEAWRDKTWQRTLECIHREFDRGGIDLFLSYLYPVQVDVGAIKEIQRLGIPCVNFFCDNVREFCRPPGVFSVFDLNWIPEFEALEQYRTAGYRYLHAPMPCWVPPGWRTVPDQEAHPPIFIGSSDALRRALLGQALKLGANIYISGTGWNATQHTSERRGIVSIKGSYLRNQFEHVRRLGVKSLIIKAANRALGGKSVVVPANRVLPPLSNEEYARVSREAMVTLGINRVPTDRALVTRPLTYSRLRDIEAPMLGACYLTEHTEGLCHLYDLGKEVETYRNADEMVEKLQELTLHPKRRLELRASAQRRALLEHSLPATLKKIAGALDIRN